MRHVFLKGTSFLGLLLCLHAGWSQELDWTPHHLDSLFLIYHPSTVVENTSHGEGVFLHQAISSVGASSFLSQRVWRDPQMFENDFTEEIYDEKNLEFFYGKVLEGYIVENSFEVAFKQLKEHQGYLTLHFGFADSSHVEVSEGYIYLLNGVIYMVAYSNPQGIQTSYKEAFLTSIKISKNQEIRQFSGNINSFYIGRIMGTVLLLVLVSFITYLFHHLLNRK